MAFKMKYQGSGFPFKDDSLNIKLVESAGDTVEKADVKGVEGLVKVGKNIKSTLENKKKEEEDGV